MAGVPASFGSVRVGDIKITYLPDGEAHFGYSVFPGTPDECWVRHVEQTAAGRWVCTLGGFLVETGDKKVLVDLGFGETEMEIPDFARLRSGQLLNSLARTGVAPADVDAVIFTHMHADHTGWAVTGDQLTFSGARHLAGPGELEHWQDNPGAPFSPAALLALADRFEQTADNETIAPGVQVMHAAGHTPGHQVVVISSGADRAMILGDTIHCSAQIAEPEMRFLFDMDAPAARHMRESLLDQLGDAATVVCASHFSGSVFGRVVTGEGKRYWSAL